MKNILLAIIFLPILTYCQSSKTYLELIDDAKMKARKILKDHIDELHIIAQGLLDYETLSGDEINDLIKGIKPSRDEFDDSNSSKPTPPKPSVPKTGSTTAPQPN